MDRARLPLSVHTQGHRLRLRGESKFRLDESVEDRIEKIRDHKKEEVRLPYDRVTEE